MQLVLERFYQSNKIFQKKKIFYLKLPYQNQNDLMIQILKRANIRLTFSKIPACKHTKLCRN